MASPIVDALPGINSSLIGLGAALYTAYVAYGYQKIWEAHNLKIKTQDEIKSFRQNGGSLGTKTDYKNNLFTPNYWNDAIKVRFEAAANLMRHMQEGGELHSFRHDGKLLDKLDPLIDLRIEITGSLDYALEALCETNIDEQSLLTFQKRLEDIENFIDASPDTAVFFGGLADRALANPTNGHSTSTNIKIMQKFVERTNYCISVVLPQLSQIIKDLRFFTRIFQLRKNTLWSIGIMVWISFFGIFLPPTVVTVAQDMQIILPFWGKYFLLILNIAPYAFMVFWAFKKIYDLPYK